MNPFLNNNKSKCPELDSFLTDILVNEDSNWTEYKIRKLNETSKMKVTDKVVSKLFRSIRDKALHLNFNDIDSSKGNIRELKGYNDLVNAIKFLKNVSLSNNKELSSNKDFNEIVESIDICLKTVERYSNEFSNAYRVKNVTLMFLYQSICISLLEGTSYVIAESIELVKTATGYSQSVKNSNKLKKNNYLTAIIKFNEIEKNNKLKKIMSEMQNMNEAFGIATMLSVAITVSMALILMRSIIFTFYQTRINLSIYLNNLRQYVLLNSTTVTDKRVKEKQEKIAEKLKKLSDMISVDQTVATDRANSDIKDSDKGTSTSTTSEDDDDMGIF